MKQGQSFFQRTRGIANISEPILQDFKNKKVCFTLFIFFIFLAPTRSSRSHSVCVSVRLWYCWILSSIFIILAQIFKLSSQLSLSCLSAVSQLSLSCLSAVSLILSHTVGAQNTSSCYHRKFSDFCVRVWWERQTCACVEMSLRTVGGRFL